MRQRSEKCIAEGTRHAHWIGLYIIFHLNWVLGPFVRGRLHNLQTSGATFARVITPLITVIPQKPIHDSGVDVTNR